MSFRPFRVLPVIAFSCFAAAVVAAALSGCSNNDSSSPTPPVTGPTFSFAFPTAGAEPPGAPGTSNKLVFNDVGTWNYHCIPHGPQGMVGSVTVLAGGPADSATVKVGSGGFQFVPSAVTIHQGGYVRWFNVSGLTTHTVSRP